MGLPELNHYKAAVNRLTSAIPQKVGKEYRDKSFEEKNHERRSDFGCKTVGLEGLLQIQNS